MTAPRQIAAGKCRVCTTNDTIYSALYCCTGCNNHLLRILRELGTYLDDYLPRMIQPARGQTGRMQPGYGSRSPATDTVIIALDPRSIASDVDEDGEAHTRRPDDTPTWIRSIPGSLHYIALGIADDRLDAKAYEGTAMDYIRRNLHWAGMQPWIDDLASDLTELHHQARDLANDKPQEAIAECLTVTCDGSVYWGGPGQPARCAACKRSYDGLNLVRLGAAAEVA